MLTSGSVFVPSNVYPVYTINRSRKSLKPIRKRVVFRKRRTLLAHVPLFQSLDLAVGIRNKKCWFFDLFLQSKLYQTICSPTCYIATMLRGKNKGRKGEFLHSLIQTKKQQRAACGIGQFWVRFVCPVQCRVKCVYLYEDTKYNIFSYRLVILRRKLQNAIVSPSSPPTLRYFCILPLLRTC